MVIHLVLQLIIGPEHTLVHMYVGITLDISYSRTKKTLSHFSCIKQAGIIMCLTVGVTPLASTT